MRRPTTLIAVTAFLLAAHAAQADTLEYSYGVAVTGTLEEIMVRVKGVPNMYPRDLVQSVELGKEGEDIVTLTSGVKRQGRLLTVRFKSDKGILTAARRQIKSIAIDERTAMATADETQPPTTVEPAEPAEPAPDDESEDVEAVTKDDLSAEEVAQREILIQNLALAKAAFEKADQMKDEEMQKLKDKYWTQAEKIIKELDRLETSIRSKDKRRREELQRYRYYRSRIDDDDRRSYRRSPDFTNDGLEKDKRSYLSKKKEKSKLKKTISDEQDKINSQCSLRKRRIRVAYDSQKKAIKEGQETAEEQMKAKYFAALDLRKRTKKDRTSTGGPLDGVRKQNPFDELLGDKKK